MIDQTSESAIRCKDLERRFGSTKAIRDIGFDVSRGSLCGLIGPNGSGKTTTLRILACDLRATDGTVEVLGYKVPSEAAKVRRRLGYVPDHAGLYPELSVEEYLRLFADLHGLSRSEAREAVGAAMELAGISPLAKRRLKGFSTGEVQRVLVARALVHNPTLLILDEPAAGLDPGGRAELRELLLILKERGKTILISSHILADLEEICSDLVLIDK